MRLPSTERLSISAAILLNSFISWPIRIGAIKLSMIVLDSTELKSGSRPPTPEY